MKKIILFTFILLIFFTNNVYATNTEEILIQYNDALKDLNSGKYEISLNKLENLIKLEPKNFEFWLKKGLIFNKLDKINEAIKSYDNAIKINPNYLAAHYNKSMLLKKSGKFDEALQEIIKCSEINLTDKDVQFQKNKLLEYMLFSYASGNKVKDINKIINLIDINSKNENDQTPVMIASEKEKIEVLKFLLQKGAFVNYENRYNDTALLLATKKGNCEIIKLLVKNGAFINNGFETNNSAMDYAVNNGNKKIIKLLKNLGAKEPKINFQLALSQSVEELLSEYLPYGAGKLGNYMKLISKCYDNKNVTIDIYMQSYSYNLLGYNERQGFRKVIPEKIIENMRRKGYNVNCYAQFQGTY